MESFDGAGGVGEEADFLIAGDGCQIVVDIGGDDGGPEVLAGTCRLGIGAGAGSLEHLTGPIESDDVLLEAGDAGAQAGFVRRFDDNGSLVEVRAPALADGGEEVIGQDALERWLKGAKLGQFLNGIADRPGGLSYS